jgi:rare lipoprotein A
MHEVTTTRLGLRASGAWRWVLVAATVAACGGTPRHAVPARHEPARATTHAVRAGVQRGMGSWYGRALQGRKTASGERFDRHKLTAAHRKLPFGTRVRVTNTRNGKAVIVRINDRGPFGGHRIIDVSEAAAKRLGMIAAGVVPVTIEVVR